jgi:hypothetical protein
MAQNHSELIFLIPWVVLIGIALSMIVSGWMIVHESHGYQENPKVKGHPEMKGVRKGDGLMTVRFDGIPDSEYDELYRRIHQQKMNELFHEPSSFEDEDLDEDLNP